MVLGACELSQAKDETLESRLRSVSWRVPRQCFWVWQHSPWIQSTFHLIIRNQKKRVQPSKPSNQSQTNPNPNAPNRQPQTQPTQPAPPGTGSAAAVLGSRWPWCRRGRPTGKASSEPNTDSEDFFGVQKKNNEPIILPLGMLVATNIPTKVDIPTKIPNN